MFREAREAVLLVNVHDALSKLKEVHTSALQQNRWHFVGNLIGQGMALSQAIGYIDPEDPFGVYEMPGSSFVDKLVGLQQELDAYTTYRESVMSQRENYTALEVDTSFGQLADMDKAIAATKSFMTACKVSWTKALNDGAANITKTFPNAAIINNPELLTDKSLQELVFHNPHRDALPKHVQTLSAHLNHVKLAQSRGIPIPQELKLAHKNASEAKVFGKTALGVDYCLDKVLHNPPPDVVQHGKDLHNELVVLRKVKLPDYVTTLINSMVNFKE